MTNHALECGNSHALKANSAIISADNRVSRMLFDSEHMPFLWIYFLFVLTTSLFGCAASAEQFPSNDLDIIARRERLNLAPWVANTLPADVYKFIQSKKLLPLASIQDSRMTHYFYSSQDLLIIQERYVSCLELDSCKTLFSVPRRHDAPVLVLSSCSEKFSWLSEPVIYGHRRVVPSFIAVHCLGKELIVVSGLATFEVMEVATFLRIFELEKLPSEWPD